MAAERPPLDPLTSEDTGPAVIIVIYALASVSVLVAVIRFTYSATHNIPFGFDDGAYVPAHVRI